MQIGINAQLLSLTDTYRATGISNYIYYLLHGLSGIDTRNRYTVFTGDWARQELPQTLSLGSNFHLRTTRLPTQYPFLRFAWEQTVQAVQTSGLDVLHCPVNVAPLLSRTRHVVTIHDLAFIILGDRFPPVKRSYLNVMTRLSARRAHLILADSENTRQDVVRLLRIPADKVVYVPLAVDDSYRWLGDSPATCSEIEAFRQKRGLPDRYFLYLGTLEPRKNIPLLLQAYAALHAKGAPDTPYLVIAGPKGWQYRDIFVQTKALGLESHVLFPGFVPREEVVWWYNAALGSVYLSAYEGFGLPPLQAMACGVPVVVNNASSLPEVVGQAGRLVRAGDAQEVACALQEIAESPELRADMRLRGLERAAQFSWRHTAERTLAAYEAAAKR